MFNAYPGPKTLQPYCAPVIIGMRTADALTAEALDGCSSFLQDVPCIRFAAVNRASAGGKAPASPQGGSGREWAGANRPWVAEGLGTNGDAGGGGDDDDDDDDDEEEEDRLNSQFFDRYTRE